MQRSLYLLIAFLGASCSPQVDAPCAVQADCSSDQVCQDGQCADAAATDAGSQCVSSLDCTEPDTRCREGQCVPIGGGGGNPDPADAGPPAEGCGDGPACSDRSLGGRRLERCVEGECRRSCLSDRMCPGDAPICIEVTDETGDSGQSCMPGECERTNDCDEGQVCESSRCRDATFCDDDSDCADNELCNGEGYCQERDGCLIDDDCDDNATCNAGYCFEAASCSENDPCAEGFDCVAGRCVEGICRRNEDCTNGQICSAGACVERSVVEPHRLVIVTPYGVCTGGGENACRLPLAVAASAQLTAMALDVNGRGIGGQDYRWSSDAPNNAAITANGLVTAVAAGQARIDVAIGQLTADRTVQVVIEPAPLRDEITVLDERGRGLSGARVAVKQAGGWRYIDGTTDDSGHLALTGLQGGAVDISVLAEGYEQTMLVGGLTKGAGALRVVLPLMRDRSARAAGFRARVDFSDVRTQGDGQLSLSGASVPDILAFDLLTLAGDTFAAELQIPGQGATSIPMPGGITFTATVFNFPINLKDTAYARGAAGLRTAWSFAGNVDPIALFGRFQGIESPSDAVLSIFPLLGAFEHGLVAGLPLSEQPLVADQDDLNGNEDRAELVPDWQSFALTELRPSTRQNGRTELVVPAANGADGSILTGGVFHPGTGFTPLGMSAHQGAGAADLPFVVAPVYGGLEGHDYIFAVLALSNDGNGVRAQMRRSPRLDNRQSFAAHLRLPVLELGNTPDSLAVDQSSGAQIVRLVSTGRDGALRVYAAPQGNASLQIDAAPGPNGAQQRMGSGAVELISLSGLPQGSAVAHLSSGQGMVFSSLGMHATGFARVRFSR